MPRLRQALTTGLAVMLVSCTQSDNRAPASASGTPAPTQEEADAKDIVVTGARANDEDAPRVRKERRADRMAYAPPPPPPLPPFVSAPSPVTGMTMPMASVQGYVARTEPRPPVAYHDVGRDKFTAAPENPFKVAREEPVSTFSIDVDTASYSFVRASLNQNVLPQPAAVRTEELVNYFPYDYAAPRSAEQPFTTNVAVFPSPWSPGRQLVRIGIRGYSIQHATRPRANLVFLIDTSGSMYAPNKLPLVKQSLDMLVDQLDANDRVAIVTYAGVAGTALEPTRASEKTRIKAVIDGLGAGGSTAGAEGIRQAYALAEQNFDSAGVNRVILTTDGDFNVGITNQDELKGYVERERGKGVFLSVLGFGMGNYNDAMMQALAQNGNGAAAYIDTVNEARKTLVDEASSTLFPIAKDVKIQVEFNPAAVSEYRLIGYETRMLNRDDFNNDKVDAGDVGSGQTVTALYEVVPVGGPRTISDLRYATPAPPAGLDDRCAPCGAAISELGFVKIRYKLPKSDTSRLISMPINRAATVARFEDAPRDARFATAVAAFAELLRGGRYSGAMRYDDVLNIAIGARGTDEFGYRSEFIQLVRAAKAAEPIARLGE
ncbi:VWA domain-containing protein [Sphingomonas oligophenolica]|uniref:VWA domain-containing protein n=1 Tax=Sphingomonas oligophenolica TaxID=301154 RepID=A0ABU9Y1M5_9SPHN